MADARGHRSDRSARIHTYAEKAMREAAQTTGWIDPNRAFESSVHVAVDMAYDNVSVRGVLEQIGQILTEPSRSNSLSQKLVQLTVPGIRDIYQGTELSDDSLVDPTTGVPSTSRA